MFPNKLILQSLITVPKNLQLYTAATVNSSILTGQTRATHYVSCAENSKNGTIEKILLTNITGSENEVITKSSFFSISLDASKKVRKVNHNTQIPKIFHQRTKAIIPYIKSRNTYQDTRKSPSVRNGNRIFKHRSQISQNTIRFITSRSGILPPPSSGNSKNIIIPVNSDMIPQYKINVKFNGTIPPPTSPNENLIRDHAKDLPETSFNIRMSKGRKIRPPSGTDKRCMCSGRILKTCTVRMSNDFTLLKTKETLQKTLKCFIHTTRTLTDEEKNSISKQIEETKQNEIYYKQHFPQPFSSPFDKIDLIPEYKKSRHFMKSYLRPINLPPPTPKRIKVQTSNSLLPPVYNLEVKNDFTPSLSIKEKTKSPLLDLLEKTKRAVENAPLPMPLNLNFSTSNGLRTIFDTDEDPKKSIYVKMQGNTFRNDSYSGSNADKESQNDAMAEYERTDKIPYTDDDNKTNYEVQSNTSNAGDTSYANNKSDVNNTADNDNNYMVDMGNKNYTEKSVDTYNTTNVQDNSMKGYQQQKVDAERLEEQENAIYTESPEETISQNEVKVQTKFDPQGTSAYFSDPEAETKSNKNDDTVPVKSYILDSGYQASNVNNISSSEDNIDSNIQDNKLNYQTSSMSNTLSTVGEMQKVVNNQEPKYNFHAANISNALSQDRTDGNPNRMEENTDYQTQSQQRNDNKMNYPNSLIDIVRDALASEKNDTNVDDSKAIANEHMKLNFQAADMNNERNVMNNGMPSDLMDNSSYNPNMLKQEPIENTPYFKAMETMNRNQVNQTAANNYFDSINRIEESPYNAANQMMNDQMMFQNMYNGMSNESGMSMIEQMQQGGGSRKSSRPKRFMKQFMKNSRGLAELAKSFNQASMFIPKQNLWKKFKFPAPSPSSYYQSNDYDDDMCKQNTNEKDIPKFKSFKEAREYFVQPDNLKKLSPSQIAMYNSILYYENVIKKHAEEIKRQKTNLESTQQALKVRKTKMYKNKSNE